MRPEFWSATGCVRGTDLPLTVVCSASEENRSYLFELAFGTSFRERILGFRWLWNISRQIRDTEQDCAILFVEVRGFCRRLLRGEDWFDIPCWVAGDVLVPIDPAFLRQKRVKNDLRKIQKHALGYEVTRDAERVNEFYRHMYRPHVTKAHGRRASVTTYETIRKHSRNCELLLVRHEGQDIAGILLIYESKGPRLWLLGVRDANPEYVQLGAIAASYHFSFQYLEAKGYRKVRFGASRAFLRDGVLHYKTKLAQRIVGSTRGVFAMKISSWTPATQAFLVDNPFIYKDHGHLCGAVYKDGDAPLSDKDLQRIQREFLHPGMSKLVVHFLGEGATPGRDIVPEDIQDHIVLRARDPG